MANYEGSTIQSVAKAITLINCLADAKRPLSLQEITLRTGWAKSTIHGLLSTLREFNLIEQSGIDGKYRLGVRLFELGNIVASTWDVLMVAKPHMHNIALRTGESVHIGMVDKDELLYLDQVDTGSPLRVVAAVGMRLPVNCSALGKAILAHLPEFEVDKLLQSGMKALTPHSITDSKKFKAELDTIRANGFAVENGEVRVGMRSVASCIFDVYGNPVYAIGVTGMFRNLEDPVFSLSEKLVKEEAAAISIELGYHGNAQY